MCGKDFMRKHFTWDYVGSPPHVRERLLERNLFVVRSRITPACAGKTLTPYKYRPWI